MERKELIDKLEREKRLTRSEWIKVIDGFDRSDQD